MTTTRPSNPHSLPATTHSYLARAAESLARRWPPPRSPPATPAPTWPRCGPRPRCSPPGPGRPPARRRPQKNAWVLLAEVAPELGEWAGFFAAGAAKRAAAEAGSTRAVTEREADDLVRDADRFLGRGGAVARPGAARPTLPACQLPSSPSPRRRVG